MSTIKNSSVSPANSVKAVSFSTLNASKLPGAVEDKNYEWIFEINEERHQVTMRHDMKTGAVEACLDGKPFVKRRVPPNDIFYSYFYDFQVDGHYLDIMHTSEACQLNIDDVSFTELYNKEHSQEEKKLTFMSVVRKNLERAGQGREFSNVRPGRQPAYMPPGVGMGQYGVMMGGSMSSMHQTRGMMKQEVPRQVEPNMTAALPYGVPPYGQQPMVPQNISQVQTPPMRPPPPPISPPSQKPPIPADLNIPLFDQKGSLVGDANSSSIFQSNNGQWKVDPPSLSGSLFANPQLNALALAFAAFYFAPPPQNPEKPQNPNVVPQKNVPPQGPPPYPMGPQGIPPQGIPPQGIPPQNMPPQGPPSYGIPPQGIPPQGFPPQGPPPYGIPPLMPRTQGMPNVPPQTAPINRPPLPNKPPAKDQKIGSLPQIPQSLPVMQASEIQTQKDIRRIESHLIEDPLVSGSIKTIQTSS